MKTSRLLYPFSLCALVALTAIAFTQCTGCKTGGGRYDPGTGLYDTNALADPVVVAAENVRADALETFDLFVVTEKTFRKQLYDLNPQIKEAADNIRANGNRWLDDLTDLKRLYQTERTAENKLKLQGALDILRKALTEAQDYSAQAKAKGLLLPPTTPPKPSTNRTSANLWLPTLTPQIT